jgi:hypothetical protein
MKKINRTFATFFVLTLLTFSCKQVEMLKPVENIDIEKKVNEFASFTLNTDLSVLSENQKKMLPLLFEAAEIMNELFWVEAYGDKEELLSKIDNENLKQFVKINYGPWERLDGNKSFIQGIGEKPLGANFYPNDITKEEFDALESEDKNSLYTLIRRDEDGNLKVIPYHEAFKSETEKVSDLLKQAAELADDAGFKEYLTLRAEALLTDDYLASDMAWMDMKENTIDFVVGPIENYEDALFGIKTAHEAYILIKDKDWSDRLQKYAALLPDLQKQLPVADEYKQEVPGSDSDLGAYDVIYYAGDCNAGSKTIAINLPNDERVHLEKGSRRLQLKNSMQAKFDKILVPISEVLITPEQRKHVTFDAFFENTMFHEVAHGLGIKETINGKGSVRESLQSLSTTLEEGKADILGLFMVTKLQETGELDIDLMDNYVTFMAGIFRSIRFGASSSHGRANLIRYNYFKEKEAFTLSDDGTFTVNFEKMQEAMNSLSDIILTIQGDGNYEAASKLLEEKGVITDELQNALDMVNSNNIPVDIVFEQGLDVLGL